MRCEVVAVGTELLLGQIVDTNSAWIGEQLAASGIDSYEHRVIGDNQARIVAALRDLFSRSDAVLVCGGLGPTQDDLTRDAIAELMGVPLVRHDDLAEHIAQMFRSRVRDMPQNNLRQADVPEGGEPLPNPLGTAPGLCCPVGDGKVVYAVPGVPYEMQEMVRAQVIPDLLRRSGEVSAIVSRSLKTWGTSESALAEIWASVLGVETQASWSHLRKGTRNGGEVISFITPRIGTTVENLGSIAGRIGYAWDHWLAYAKGGGAWAHDVHRISSETVVPEALLATTSVTRWGWMIGAGLEYGLTPNWSAKLEWNYLDFGREQITFTNVGVPGGPATFPLDIKQGIHLAKLGINYRFGGPVYAKY
jgi:molybdenum cofactor synthesis domain-containing protein